MFIKVIDYQRDSCNGTTQITFDSGVYCLVMVCFYPQADNHLATEKFEFKFSHPKTRVVFVTDENPVFFSIDQVTTETNTNLTNPIGFVCNNFKSAASQDIDIKFQKGLSMLLTHTTHATDTIHTPNTTHSTDTSHTTDTTKTTSNTCELKNENVYAKWIRKSVN